FEAPVGDPLALLDDHDLLVGADGVHSLVRSKTNEPGRDRSDGGFGTSLELSPTRLAWFGAERAFEVFTFIFEPTRHGLFQVHAYPFDASRSTFIVECTDATWRRAGLEAMTEEESLAFCQDLFAAHLDGRSLRSNRSTWNRFPTVRNRRWHRQRVVLVGDAAHTAHFSIGSGTRLAMDDAIALVKATIAHPTDLESALRAYEAARIPVVERFQAAAAESARYFESVERTLSLPLEQFAFHLLSRSGRLGRLELERRDAVFVNRVDRSVAGRPERLVTVPPFLVPLALSAGCTLRNRVVLAPSAPDDALDGVPGDSHRRALVSSAVLGAGLVVSEPVAVAPAARVTSGSAGIWNDAQARAWADLVEAVHHRGGALALRISHAGRRGATYPRHRGLDRPLRVGAWPLLAPSPLPYTSRSQVPQEMEQAALTEVASAFRAAAARGAAAGFDLLILDVADGYLLASFLSPLTNHRRDAYGGDLAGRARFPLEVFAAVRSVWPTERPLVVRLAVDDRAPGGLIADDGVDVARRLRQAGCEIVEATAGHTVPGETGGSDYRRLFNAELAGRVRDEVGPSVIVAGRITLLDDVNTLIAAGRADLCTLDPAVLEPPEGAT
ncbi:MAG: FAD-dependent monooxygenase, partial [Acidimicrobiia bacterium]